MKKTTFLLPIIFVLSLFSCKKETERIKLHEIVKSYFYYKTGSWWEYEQEDTAIIERVIVRSGGISILKVEPESEILDIRLRSDIILKDLDLSFSCYARNGEQDISISYPNAMGGSGCIANADSLYSLNSYRGDYKFERLDSIVVKGKVYHDIIHIITGSINLDEFYIAAGVGIIKKTSNHKVYNLVKYQIL